MMRSCPKRNGSFVYIEIAPHAHQTKNLGLPPNDTSVQIAQFYRLRVVYLC